MLKRLAFEGNRAAMWGDSRLQGVVVSGMSEKSEPSLRKTSYAMLLNLSGDTGVKAAMCVDAKLRNMVLTAATNDRDDCRDIAVKMLSNVSQSVNTGILHHHKKLGNNWRTGHFGS